MELKAQRFEILLEVLSEIEAKTIMGENFQSVFQLLVERLAFRNSSLFFCVRILRVLEFDLTGKRGVR